MLVCASPLRRVPTAPASLVFRGDDVEPPVPEPLLSSFNSSGGISTRSLGRKGPPGRKLLCRDGGVKLVSDIEETDVRDSGGNSCAVVPSATLTLGGESGALLPFIRLMSTECVALFVSLSTLPLPQSAMGLLFGTEDEDQSGFDGPLRNAARCCDRIDRFSSIGVKILYCFRCGSFFTSCHSGVSLLGSLGDGGCGS